VRCCWENNSRRRKPEPKIHGKKGEMNKLVSCPRNLKRA
jgi:hypothetical protein